METSLTISLPAAWLPRFRRNIPTLREAIVASDLASPDGLSIYVVDEGSGHPPVALVCVDGWFPSSRTANKVKHLVTSLATPPELRPPHPAMPAGAPTAQPQAAAAGGAALGRVEPNVHPSGGKAAVSDASKVGGLLDGLASAGGVPGLQPQAVPTGGTAPWRLDPDDGCPTGAAGTAPIRRRTPLAYLNAAEQELDAISQQLRHIPRLVRAASRAVASLPGTTPFAGEDTCFFCRAQPAPAGAQHKDAVALPCGHAFHRHCVAPWLQEKGTCPTCGGPFFIPP